MSSTEPVQLVTQFNWSLMHSIEAFLTNARCATTKELHRRFESFGRREIDNAICYLKQVGRIVLNQITNKGDKVWSLPGVEAVEPEPPAPKQTTRVAVKPTVQVKQSATANLGVHINETQYTLIYEFAQERGTTVEAAASYLLNKGLDLLLLVNTYKS